MHQETLNEGSIDSCSMLPSLLRLGGQISKSINETRNAWQSPAVARQALPK